MTPEELTELPDGYYQVTWNSFFLHTDRTIEKRGNGGTGFVMLIPGYHSQ